MAAEKSLEQRAACGSPGWAYRSQGAFAYLARERSRILHAGGSADQHDCGRGAVRHD
jgi:hypothetical protein